MIIKKNGALHDNMNNIRLRLLDHGHAITTEEWSGNIVSPMYSRIYYILGGDPYVTVDGRRIPLKVGRCYLFPTGFSFRHAFETSMEQLYFHVNLNDYNGTDLLRSCPGMMEYTPTDGTVQKMLEWMFSDDVSDSLKLHSEICSAIFSMADNCGVKFRATNYSPCVLLAIEYIRTHLSLRLSISSLSAHTFVSESTLSKKFKNEVGMTIGNYIDETVLFEAEQLLLRSNLTVLQISERFGFCDQFYFSRRFKQKYGTTPQKYRKLRLI